MVRLRRRAHPTFTAGKVPEPPLHIGWRFQDYALLEFPPVIYGNTLYVMDDDASAKELDSKTGHKVWETKVGTLAAASPALGVKQGLMYLPVLSAHGHSPGNGRFVALSMKTGPDRVVEGDPRRHRVLADRRRQFGVLRRPGRERVLAERDHRSHQLDLPRERRGQGWPRDLATAILYFGDYSGRAYALNATTGHEVWAVNTNGADFGFGSGNFYSTPAVAFGRVYMGNTDGRVYSFAAKHRPARLGHRHRRLRVRVGGGRRHARARPDRLPRLLRRQLLRVRREVGRDQVAASGRAARSPGSATIVGNVVYYSDLGTKTTAGLDVRTGRQVFSFPDGAFNPVVADDGAIYLSGYTMLYQMLPEHD